ncbi:replication protein A 70 kDa DNA-binding subunit B [Tanacetum coccineum]
MKGKFGYQKESKSHQKENKARTTINKSHQKGNKSLPTESMSSSKKKTLKHSQAMQPSNKITPIKDLSPMVCNMSIKGRVISIWHAHKLNQARDPYSLECVLQDEHFDDNFTGFKSEPFTRILDTNEEYEEHNSVDVIGTVVGIGEIVAVNSIGSKKIRRTVVIKDEDIQCESGWTYIGCKVCSKKVEPVAAKGPSTSRTKQTWWCTKHESQEQVASRYKMIVRLMDESGTAQLCIFDGNMHKMSGFTAWELVEKYGPNTSTYFPEELNVIIGKRFLFRVKFSEFNHNNNSHVYRCERVTNDEEIINFWKQGFVGDQDSEEDSEEDVEENNEEDMKDGMETPAALIKSTKVLDLSITRRLHLETPSDDCIGSSSVHTSGSEKKSQRTVKCSIVVIDLSDSEYDTKDDEKEPNAKKPMVAVDQDAIAQKAIVTIKKEKDVEQNVEKDEEPK